MIKLALKYVNILCHHSNLFKVSAHTQKPSFQLMFKSLLYHGNANYLLFSYIIKKQKFWLKWSFSVVTVHLLHVVQYWLIAFCQGLFYYNVITEVPNHIINLYCWYLNTSCLHPITVLSIQCLDRKNETIFPCFKMFNVMQIGSQRTSDKVQN